MDIDKYWLQEIPEANQRENSVMETYLLDSHRQKDKGLFS